MQRQTLTCVSPALLQPNRDKKMFTPCFLMHCLGKYCGGSEFCIAVKTKMCSISLIPNISTILAIKWWLFYCFRESVEHLGLRNHDLCDLHNWVFLRYRGAHYAWDTYLWAGRSSRIAGFIRPTIDHSYWVHILWKGFIGKVLISYQDLEKCG